MKRTRTADSDHKPGDLLRVELKESMSAGAAADAYVLFWNLSTNDFNVTNTVIEIIDPFETATGTARNTQTQPITEGTRFWVRYSADARRWEILTAAAAATDKILYLDLNDTDNYLLPQAGLAVPAVGYEWTPHATNFSNIDFTTSYVLVEYFGSICLPGGKVQCRFNSALDAWTPWPYGQNALQPIRIYKEIEAGSVTNGDEIWFIGFDGASTVLADLVEGNELRNDFFLYDWAHSGQNIVADAGNPVEAWAYLFHEGGGCNWRIIGKACNPEQLA